MIVKLSRKDKIRGVIIGVIMGVSIPLLVACTTASDPAPDAAAAAVAGNKALQPEVYVQKNNIEFNNYNKRQQISDNPTTILWCTYYPTNQNAKPITVPIVGKLTSSEKRPYATTQVKTNDPNGSFSYFPEVPGPDKMFGTSTPYRYGFDPAGNYWEFTSLETACTTEPTLYQTQATTIVSKIDDTMQAANLAAQAALKAGHPDEAAKILTDAAAKAGNK